VDSQFNLDRKHNGDLVFTTYAEYWCRSVERRIHAGKFAWIRLFWNSRPSRMLVQATGSPSSGSWRVGIVSTVFFVHLSTFIPEQNCFRCRARWLQLRPLRLSCSHLACCWQSSIEFCIHTGVDVPCKHLLDVTSSMQLNRQYVIEYLQKLKLSLCFNQAPRHGVLGEWRCSSKHSLPWH
jgi:hypothetical protein